ncbi:MAG: LPP20 family lipoprotein [Phycisphaerae bacterium]|nr:LPP20 family lipoprotein [Phycisphaerae bacterium]
MKPRSWLAGLAGIGVVAGFCLPAMAEVTAAQNKLLAKRAAEADAYRKLAECIQGMQINSSTYVKDFVTESDVIQSDLDTFIRGVKLGKPRWYDDGSCEVEAEVSVATIITTLKEIHSRDYKGDRIKAVDFEQMTQRIKTDKVRVVGMGAPRPDLPPDLPEGVAEELGGPPTPPRPPIPAIWQKIPVNQRLMAKRAAELDAKRKLLERIKGIRIDSRTQVRDFVTESDVINTEAMGRLTGARVVREYYHDDELIAEVTVEVPVEWVIETVKQLSVRSWQGDRLKALDYEQILRKQITKNFDATGMGTVAPQYVKIVTVEQVKVPDWPTVIRATGQGTDPQIQTPQGKLKAARAAELDAKRKLAEQIWGLQIDSNTTVRDFVTERDEIRSQVQAVLVGSYVDSTRFNDDGTVEVTVAIPSAQIWTIIYKERRIEIRHKAG